MIDKKDIDRLLAGRKIIDEIKSPDPVVLSALNAKTKKTESVSLSTVKQTLAERDALLKIEGDSIVNVEKQLIELGFKGIADFLEYNKKTCIAEAKDRLEITRAPCDGCPTKKCVELFNSGACFYDKTSTIPESMYEFFIRLRNKSTEENFSDVKICPDGYGFHWKSLREPQFDLRWRSCLL